MVLGSTAYTRVCGVRFPSAVGFMQGAGTCQSDSSHTEGDGAGCLRDLSALVSLYGMLFEELGAWGSIWRAPGVVYQSAWGSSGQGRWAEAFGTCGAVEYGVRWARVH